MIELSTITGMLLAIVVVAGLVKSGEIGCMGVFIIIGLILFLIALIGMAILFSLGGGVY